MGMAKLTNLYLFAYNSFQAIGWAISLSKILINLAYTKSLDGTYSSTGELICFLQTISFLEVIHGAIGIVPSGALLPLMQWGGRTHFALAIVRRISELQEQPAVFLTFLAWSLGEVIRYPHYALSCLGSSQSTLTYIRYTAFILLYPLGFIGEMILMYNALPFVKSKNLYANSFSGLPFTYYNFLTVLLMSYPFLWLKLYLYMLAQRKGKLGKQLKKKKS